MVKKAVKKDMDRMSMEQEKGESYCACPQLRVSGTRYFNCNKLLN